jgi:hypothetical protein
MPLWASGASAFAQPPQFVEEIQNEGQAAQAARSTLLGVGSLVQTAQAR